MSGDTISSFSENIKKELLNPPECPDCFARIDSDGDAVELCQWGAEKCETCGACICDNSC